MNAPDRRADPARKGPRVLPVAGRHTLGSDHDSPRPSASEPPGFPLAMNAGDDPKGLSRPAWWISARVRVRRLEGDAAALLTRLLDHVEHGWEQLAQIRPHTRGQPRRRGADPRVAKLGTFMSGEMNEAFGRCASIAAALVPGGEETHLEMAEIDQAADLFDRVLAVVDLAVSDPAVPAALADSVRLAAVELVDWASEFAVLASAAASDTES
jgi:hypothetical protein